MGPEPSDDQVMVVIDVNEPFRVRVLSLDHPDVTDWMEEDLATADIVVNGVGFERKTPGDFVNSMKEGRLTEQAERLAEDYEHAYLFLEGGFDDFDRLKHTKMKPASARGMAASITARYGVPVIPTGGPPVEPSDGEIEKRARTRMLVDMAIRHGRKHTEEPVSDHLPTGPVEKDAPYGMRMWGTLPNVGPALAERIYEAYGSPVELAASEHSTVPALVDIHGIGNNTATKIAAAMFGGLDDG